MGIRLVPASQGLIDVLGRRLREADELECQALGLSGAQALQESYQNSTVATVVLKDGEPIAAGGVAPAGSVLSSTGVPWCLTGSGLQSAGKSFLRASRKMVHEYMMSNYKFLYNLVDVRYEAAIRWLKWLGFTFENAVPAGVNGEMFYPFWMRSQ